MGGGFDFSLKSDFCLDSCYSQCKIKYFNFRLDGSLGDELEVYFFLVKPVNILEDCLWEFLKGF